MTIDEAIKILETMDMTTTDKFSPEEREAFKTVGTAGWSGELSPSDPRLVELPKIKELVSIMATKRIVQ